MNETKAIYGKLAAIMADASAIGKDSKNTQQGFNFRGIDAVMNHLHPLFAKHGVIILPSVLAERVEERQTKSGGNLIYRVLTIRFDFVAEDGSTASATVIGEGMDSGDKAANKAMAVALKYALTQTLLLPYDEVDPDSDSHDVKPKAAAKPAAPAAPKPAPAAPTEEQPPGNGIERGTIEAVSIKPKTKHDGTPYTSVGVKINGKWYNSLSTTIGDWATAHKGQVVDCEYTQKGTFVDIVTLESAQGREPGEEG